MAKGIIRAINTYDNSEVSIFGTDDIEETMRAFEKGIMPTRGLKAYRYKDNLKLEVVEETDNLAVRYAYYAWPKLDRVVYTEECMSWSREKGFSKKVKNAVDWLIGTYSDKKYSFELLIENNNLVSNVYENGQLSEKYTFEKKSGEPSVRQFLN